MASWFNKEYYLTLKLLQMDATGQRQGISSEVTLDNMLNSAGFTAESHYLAYGHNEGLNPNHYFNEFEYLHSKLAQLREDSASGWGGKDINQLRDFIASTGMTPLQHYEAYGAFETRADGTLLNPSNGFDANAYVQAKTYLMNTIDQSAHYTVPEIVAVFQQSGLTPMTHALLYGATETRLLRPFEMVDTVPDAQRVAADPGRAAINAVVPGNDAAPTLAPSAVVEPEGHPDHDDMADRWLPSPARVITPTPDADYKYDDLILARLEGGTLFLDVNEASPAYGLLFNPRVSSQGTQQGYIFEDGIIAMQVGGDPNDSYRTAGGDRIYNSWLLNMIVSGGDTVKLFDGLKLTIPVDTKIDISALSLSDTKWDWGYRIVENSSWIEAGDGVVISNGGVTVKTWGSGSEIMFFAKGNTWTTSGTVEILSDSGKQAKQEFAPEDTFILDGTADDDMAVDLMGVNVPADDMVGA